MAGKRRFKVNILDLTAEEVLHEATIVAETPEELAKYIRRVGDNVKQLEFDPIKETPKPDVQKPDVKAQRNSA